MTYTSYPRTLYASQEWYDTGITIHNGDTFNINANGGVKPWDNWDSYYPMITPDGARFWPTNNPNSRVYIQGAPFCMLIGKIGANGTPFRIGSKMTFGLIGDPNHLYLAINDVLGFYSDNAGSFAVTINVGTPDPVVTEPPVGGHGCTAKTSANSTLSSHPISLYDGEKREAATDLIVSTPAGALEFVRSYRQNKQTHTDFQFMGLGWTHNHLGKLTLSGSSPNRSADVLLPGGGRLQFSEDSGNAGHFLPPAESLSVLDEDTLNSAFILTAQDKIQYVFDATSFLLSRIDWPSNESWTYSYASGRLSEVDDGYGRKLVFAYVSNPGQYDDGQLWRVGDHATTSLTATPSGRYVEFGYTPEKEDGSTITTPKALLASVRDVRGNTWTYKWYGQDSGDDDPDQLNFLLEVNSPSVDTSGDGTPDSSITLKRLSYTIISSTITGITQDLGIQDSDPELMQTTYEFQADGLNETHETTAGKVTKHLFTSNLYAGKVDPAGNSTTEWHGFQYRPETRKDGNGNDLQLAWSEDGKYLLQITDGLANQTQFSYNTSGISADTLQESTDAQGRKTVYSYDDLDNPRLPTRIQVLNQDEVTVLRWQEFSYDAKGRVLTETLYDPNDGTTVLQQVSRTYYASGDSEGLLESVTQEDPINSANNTSTVYTYDSYGRVVKTQQTSLLGTCEFSYTVYDEAGNVVATVCGRQNVTAPASVAAAIALYDEDDPDKNRVTTHEYDTLGRQVSTTVNAGADTAQTTLTVYDALNRVIRTITNYAPDVSVTHPYTSVRSAFDHGTENNQNLVTDTVYNALGQVRKQIDPLGNVTLYGYEDSGRLVKTVQSASEPDYNNDYVGTDPDPSLAAYVVGEAADEDIVTAQAYDGAGNLVKTVDALGRVDYTVYDVLNRPFKTVRAARDEASIALNPGDEGYDPDVDPRWESYIPSTDPDRDLIETTEYDALGRVIRTRRLLENRVEEIWDTTLFGYDALGRQIKVIQKASQPTYNLSADPSLAGYSASSSADQDIVSQTAYDPNGRVLYTEDTSGSRTWIGYDGLGRQIRTVLNAVGTETDDGANDPRSSSYVPSSDADKDLISTTTYNADGQVESTQDALDRVTRNVYDTRGRVIRTIANYVAQGMSDPADWDWDDTDQRWEDGAGNAISFGTDQDQNVISDTTYDAQGRVADTTDQRHNVTRFVYDGVGRRVKTIANYVAQGTSDPADWEWDDTDQRWEDGAGNAISFGTDQDQNRISLTVYDLAGRVVSTRDAAGIETRFSYDAAGRRTQTISNYVDGSFDALSPDEDLISITAYNKGGQVVSTTDARGTETAFTYDTAGRRLQVTQASGSTLATTSYTVYDKAGRILRSIANYVTLEGLSPDTQTAGEWDFVPPHHGSNNDTNLITDFAYDLASRQVSVTNPVGNVTQTAYRKDGQVDTLTDPEGVITQYCYDALRRRTHVIQNYVVQDSSDPQDWVWVPDPDPESEEDLSAWKQSSMGSNIEHGDDNDQNIIVIVTYDKGGRVLTQQEPRGSVTTYAYDDLDRRKTLVKPITVRPGLTTQTWRTAYANLSNGKSQVTTTYPGITDLDDYDVIREFDRLGRLSSIDYNQTDPDTTFTTPNVAFSYDAAGNRILMSENDGIDDIRKTNYSYDALHRLTSAAFDTDGDSISDETVSYAYDAGGLRTQLTLPDDLTIVYGYDARGRLISMTDWDEQETQFAYDRINRHIDTQRATGLHSTYAYDAAGRLKRLRHVKDVSEIANAPAFSGTNILDDFNRSDGGLGINWERGDYLAIDTNQVVVGYSTTDVYWVGDRYGADQEAFVTLSSINESSEEIDLLLKSQSTYTNAVIEVLYNPVSEKVQVWTYTVADDWIQHGADLAVTFADGDQFGARAFRDGTVEIYKNGVLLGSRNVSAWPYYQADGYIGLFFYLAEDTVFDNFGGGSILVSPPTSDVLDDFNRADGGIGANWSGTTTDYAIDTHQLVGADTGENIYWNGEYFGPNQEAFVTFANMDTVGEIGLLLKRQSSDPEEGFLSAIYSAYEHRIQIFTYDPTDGFVQRGANIFVTFAAGDVMGAKARMNGDVEIYKNSVLWAIRSVTDWPRYAEGGYIGLGTASSTILLDDFGGGNIVDPGATMAHFAYESDGRGNRTQALEVLAQPETSSDTLIAYDDSGLVLIGTWSEVSGFVQSTDTDAVLKFMFLGDHITLSMGKGSDHAIYAIYLNGELWQSVDGYAASATQEDIEITSALLVNEGPHILEIRNQNDKNASSSGYKVRFQQAAVTDKAWDLHTIGYSYDALARLKEARYNPGIHTDALDADLLRQYLYSFDRAGNRTEQAVAINGGSPTVTNYAYNAANQLVSDGTNTLTYDNNGNLTNDGVNSYTWDRANRLLSWANGVAADLVNHVYDGEGRRVSQAIGTTSPAVTKYLLDIQPGLSVVLSETTGSDVTRNVFCPRGIHAQKDSSNNWQWIAQDGLGNVREVVDNSVGVLESRNYGPYGDTFGGTITSALGYEAPNFGFTGELVDGSWLLDLRARRYNAGMGVFVSLDPYEGRTCTPMSLNRYSYVEGDPINMTDPTGNFPIGGLMLASVLNSSVCFAQPSEPSVDCGCHGIFSFLCPAILPPCRTSTQPPPGPFATNTPPPTPDANPCASLSDATKSQLLASFTGNATLDPNKYVWWPKVIDNVRTTIYGARAARIQGVSDPNQLPLQERRDICCGQGSISIDGQGWNCTADRTSPNSVCQSQIAQPDAIIQFERSPCGANPSTANGTCTYPGKTGASLNVGNGFLRDIIGQVFAYIIPPSGDTSQALSLYINDSSASPLFGDTHIDVYVGLLDQNSLPVNSPIPSFWSETSNSRVCLLARQETFNSAPNLK